MNPFTGISAPEDGSFSIRQEYQRVFDLTADFSPSETNRRVSRLRSFFFFPFSEKLLVALLMRKCCNLFSPPPHPHSGALDCSAPPPPPSVFLSLQPGSLRGLKSKHESERGRRVSRGVKNGKQYSSLVKCRVESPPAPAVPGF